jgi:hypothetical protein
VGDIAVQVMGRRQQGLAGNLVAAPEQRWTPLLVLGIGGQYTRRRSDQIEVEPMWKEASALFSEEFWTPAPHRAVGRQGQRLSVHKDGRATAVGPDFGFGH